MRTLIVLTCVCFTLFEVMLLQFCEGDHVLTKDQHEVVVEMCEAQRQAGCYDVNDVQICKNTINVSNSNIWVNEAWITNCTEPHLDSTETDCVGTCSTIAGVNGYVPSRPDVTIYRDHVTRLVELSWRPDTSSTPVVYVVAQQWPNITGDAWHLQLDWIRSNTYQIDTSFDICSIRDFSVAAVSHYGSFWFSNSVQTPVSIPGPPEEITMTTFEYTPNTVSNFISFTMEWQPPVGWNISDILPDHKFTYLTNCPPISDLDMVYVFIDNFKLVISELNLKIQDVFSMTGRIPTYAIGCTITFLIRCVSRCSPAIVGSEGNYTLELSCDKFPDYTGQYCGNSPVLAPGPVKNVRFTIVPNTDGCIGLVSWRPPDNKEPPVLVESYHIFWGIMDLRNTDPIKDFTNLLGHMIVPGTQFEVDLVMNITWQDFDQSIGVVVSAAGTGQAIDVPYSDIYLPLNRDTPLIKKGHVIEDDGTILVVQDDGDTSKKDKSVRCELYWRPFKLTEETQNSPLGYDLYWGILSHSLSISDGILEAVNEPDQFPTNVTRTEQDYVSLPGLKPNVTYGVMIVPVYNMSSVILNEQNKSWTDDVHTFTTLPLPDRDTVTVSPAWSYTPTAAAINKEPRSLGTVNTIVLSLAVLVVVAISALVYNRWNRQRILRHQTLAVINLPDPEYRDYFIFTPETSLDSSRPAHCPVVVDEWELPVSCVKFGPVLGFGAFGKVVKGRVTRAMLTHRGVTPLLVNGRLFFDDASSLHVTVAIKMLQEDCDRRYKDDFLKEIQLMKRIGHHEYVVSMLGCCTLRDPICLIVEHAEFGDLLTYLKDARRNMISTSSEGRCYVNCDARILSPKDLLLFAWHVTQGMDFLASKGFVHRDLAARNVLVCTNRICKIGDFGLARYIYDNVVYVNRRGGRLPVKWMSVEAIFDMSFSTASDVWSFGILLFEIITLGGTPYPTIPTRDLLSELQRGYRMEKPDNCSTETYEMMIQCWQANPKERPTFSFLSQWLNAMMSDASGTAYLDMPLNIDTDLYQADDEDVTMAEQTAPPAINQDSLSGSVSSEYSIALSLGKQNTLPVCRESMSGDSGYSSPQKESVSSGESAMHVLTDTTYDSSYWTDNNPNVQHAESQRHCTRKVSENCPDDVFHEDNETDEDIINKTRECIYQRDGRAYVMRKCHYSNELIDFIPDSDTSSHHPSRYAYPRRCSLPTSKPIQCHSVDHALNIRRRSDSDVLTSSQKSSLTNKSKLELPPCVNELRVLETPLRTTKHITTKHRRKAVVISPTLILDNDMYHAIGKHPQQNPPPTHILRKKPRNNGSHFICPETWTSDGQFNFEKLKKVESDRNGVSLHSHEVNIGHIPDDYLSDRSRSGNSYTVLEDVQREFSSDHDGKVKHNLTNEVAILPSVCSKKVLEVSLSEPRREQENKQIEHGLRSAKSNKTFVRSFSNALSSTNTRTPCGTRKKTTHQDQRSVKHHYADLKNILNQSCQTRGINNEKNCPDGINSCHLLNKAFHLQGDNDALKKSNCRDCVHRLSENSIRQVNGCENCDQSMVQFCPNTSIYQEDLGSLSRTVTRTYSSPKESTVPEIILCDKQDDHTLSKISFKPFRRLSDPFTMSIHRKSLEICPATHPETCSGKSLLSTLYSMSLHSSTTSPWQQATRFRLPQMLRRKDTPLTVLTRTLSQRDRFPMRNIQPLYILLQAQMGAGIRMSENYDCAIISPFSLFI